MEPVGLTYKNIEHNPYTGRTSGELMVVHLCRNCGRISCNRIAGDDNAHTIVCLLEKQNSLTKETITRLSSHGIRLLTQDDKHEVLASLFGYDYQKYSK
jgi:hypothetical protein